MKNLMKRLDIQARLTLISISFSLPIAVLLVLMVRGINEDIQFARWETYGNVYQRPLEELVELLPQHQLLARGAGNGDEGASLSTVQSRIDQTFGELEAVQARLGQALQFTAAGLAKRKREHVELQNVKREWDSLKQESTKITPEVSREKHEHLLQDVRTMITHAGDLSNLILDIFRTTSKWVSCNRYRCGPFL